MADGHHTSDTARDPDTNVIARDDGPGGAQGDGPDDGGTAVPPGAVSRRRAGVTAAVTAGAVALVVVMSALAFFGGTGSGRTGEEGDVPGDLKRQLAAQITQVLEAASPTEHLHHGHGFSSPGLDPVICAVEPFGVEPADAENVLQVKHVYARHICAVDDMNGTWNQSVRASGPIAVDMNGGPIQIHVPKSGAGYPEHVRELIPARYQELAFQNFADVSVIDAARKRFDALPPRPQAPPV